MREPSIDIKERLHKLSGPEKAAIFVLTLAEKSITPVFERLDQSDIKQISLAMISLGRVQAELVEGVLWEYISQIKSTGSLMGSLSGTEKLLLKILPKEKVDEIMNDVKGPAGKTVWDKLSNVKDEILANYLRKEYPQTIAVILSKIKAENAAKIIATFPEELAINVIRRMISMDGIQKKVIDDLEKTLRTEFMGNLSKSSKRDPYEAVADIFNALDRSSEERLMKKLEEESQAEAEAVKALMFTFDDFKKLDQESIRNIIRNVDKSQLALSLKGVSKELQNIFFNCMTERAAKLMRDEMKELGMVRIKEVDSAQLKIVTIAKELAETGEVVLNDNDKDGDQLVG